MLKANFIINRVTIQDGRTGFEDNGEDIRVKGDAAAHAGLRCGGKDKYTYILMLE